MVRTAIVSHALVKLDRMAISCSVSRKASSTRYKQYVPVTSSGLAANEIRIAGLGRLPDARLTRGFDIGCSSKGVRTVKFAAVELLGSGSRGRHKLNGLVSSDIFGEGCILGVNLCFGRSEPDVGGLRDRVADIVWPGNRFVGRCDWGGLYSKLSAGDCMTGLQKTSLETCWPLLFQGLELSMGSLALLVSPELPEHNRNHSEDNRRIDYSHSEAPAFQPECLVQECAMD